MLALAPVFAGFYLLLPTTGYARTVAYPVFGIVATITILVAVHVGRPARPGSWRLIAVSLACLSMGDLVYTIDVFLAAEVPYPSAADIPYVVGYLALAAGIHGLSRGPGDRRPLRIVRRRLTGSPCCAAPARQSDDRHRR